MPERMGQWTLLGHGSDPVVADTVAVSDRVAHYRDVAEQMQTNAARLDRIADGSALKGKYADELRSSSKDVAKDLHQVVGRYQAVASALETYEPELEHALSESMAALDDAVAANGAGQAADDMPTATAEEGKTLTAEQTAQNDAKTAATNRAADALSAAKGRLNRALDALDGAGRAASATIKGGFHDGLKDSGWDRFVYAFMKFLKILVKVLTYLAMALAVIALVIPGLGPILFAAAVAISVVDVAANAALVASGEGSWADFGIALAGLLTFGVGKLFGPAIQAGLKSIGNGVKSSVNGALDTARGLRGGPRPAVAGDGASSLSSGRSSFSGGSGTGGRATTADDLPSVPTHEPRAVTADDFPSVPTHEPRAVTADDFPAVPTHEPRATPAGDVPSRPATPDAGPSRPATPDAGPSRPGSPEVDPAALEEAAGFLPGAFARQGDSMVFRFRGNDAELQFRGEDPDTFAPKFTVRGTGEDVRFDVDENAFVKADGSPADFTKIHVDRPADGYVVRNFEGQTFPKADTLDDLARMGNPDTPVLVRLDQLPVTVRGDAAPARIASIGDAIRNDTPLPAVGLSRPGPGGTWTINDGNHRIQAARDAGLEYLPVTIS